MTGRRREGYSGAMDIRPGLDLAQLSDVGMVRERNEDALGYWESDNEDEFREKGRLAMVADGMGGHEGGQLASDIAVRTVCEVYREAAGLKPPALIVIGDVVRLRETLQWFPEKESLDLKTLAAAERAPEG